MYFQILIYLIKNCRPTNNSDVDVVQLNWINNLISLKEISKINKPLIWRFSDMWPFIGTSIILIKLINISLIIIIQLKHF